MEGKRLTLMTKPLNAEPGAGRNRGIAVCVDLDGTLLNARLLLRPGWAMIEG